MWLMTALFSLLTTNLIFTRALGTSTMLAAAKNSSNLAVLSLLETRVRWSTATEIARVP